MSADFVQRGRLLIEQDQYQEAVKVCRLGLLAHPTELEGRLVLGAALMALRRYDEVLAEMRAALELQATHPRALALKAEALLSKGDALQATEILTQASQFAPNDPVIQQLHAEAQRALASGAAHSPGQAPSAFDDSTSHYPLPGGALPGSMGAGASSQTLPGKGLARRGSGGEVPPPEVLAVGDRSGTMTLDPELDAEIIEEDPLIDPPGPLGSGPTSIDMKSAEASFSPIELDTGDIISADESGAKSLPSDDPFDGQVVGFDSAYGHESQSTVAYAGKRPEPRRSRDPYPQPQRYGAMDVDPEGPTEAVEAFGDLGPLPPREQGPPSSALEFPADFPHGDPAAGAPPPGLGAPPAPQQPAEPAGWVDDLFPEAQDPSSLEVPAAPYYGGAPGAGAGFDPRADPGAGAAALGLARSPSEDMRLIRAGLGMPEDSNPGSRPVARQLQGGASASFGQPQPQPQPHAQQPPAPAQLDRPGAMSRTGRTGKKRKRKRRRRGVPLVVYALIALAVVGGAVFAGFKVRDARLDRQIAAAQEDAKERELSDTFAGYLEAQDAYERILSAKDTQKTRAALARISAALAADFGYQRKEASERVEELGDLKIADAVVARAYLALARHDAGAAAELAAKVKKEYPDDRSAHYLVGRAALLAGEAKRAAKAFRKGLDERVRPGALVGLAAAELLAGRTSEALAAVRQATDKKSGVPGHPSAVILEARILALSSGLPDDSDEPEKSLEALMKEAARPIPEQDLGVSAEQAAWAAIALAEVKLARGDRNAARRALGRAAKLDAGESALLSETLAHLLVQVGDTKAAKKEAEHAAKRWPERTAAHVLLAEVALAEDSPERALSALKKAGDLKGSAEALAVRGRAYLAANELDKATADLDAALEVQPGLRSAVIASAEVALRRGDARAALKKLEPLYDEAAEPELVVAYASALRESGDRGKAREVLGRILTGAPTPDAYIGLARIERDEGKYSEARAAYQKAIELAPSALKARLEAALLTLDVGDALGARESLDALAEDAPEAARVLVEAARVRTLTGDLEGALELLEKAGELPAAPVWKIARERGRALIYRGELKEAVKELNRAQSLEPTDGATRYLLLEVYARLKNTGEVRKVLGSITKEFRGTALLKLSQGRVAFLDERFPDAISAFKEAASILSENKAPPRELAEVDQWIGRCHLVLGDFAKAKAWLGEALKKDPSNADAYFWLGNLYYDTGVPKEAALNYNKAIELNPAVSPKAYFYGGVSYSDLGMKPKAKELLQTFVELAPKDIDAPEARRMLGEL